MAKYEREFLVPYLMNLCSLELAHRKLSEREYVLDGQAGRLRDGIRFAKKPQAPFIERLPLFWVVMGCITFVMSFLMFSLELNGLGWFFIIGGIAEGSIGYGQITEVKESNARKQCTYNREMAEYNEAQRKNDTDKRTKLPAALDELRRCQLEKRKVTETLQRAYGINVIPMQYRNIYASVFLYDWFSTSRADDLEMALNMFVLEEIKEKLDRIIANQTSIILNQQITIANQQKTMEQQKAHSAMMREKLSRIEASNEDRNMYLGMIESNTSTIAFFSAADYIKRI